MRAHEIRDISHFEEVRAEAACDYCGTFNLQVRDKGQQKQLFCGDCGRHNKFLAKGKQLKIKRPDCGAKPDEVWQAFNDHCSFCGLSGEQIAFLGLEKQIQHIPPYSVSGHEFALPICSWCNQTAAANMNRLTSLIDRLTKKFDVNNA